MRVFYPRFNKDQVVQLIGEKIPALRSRLPLTLVVLFGSYARGNFTAASDIDLLVVYRGAKRDDAFAITRKTISVPGLEPHIYTEEEYHQLRATIDRMVKGGIVLFQAGGTILSPS